MRVRNYLRQLSKRGVSEAFVHMMLLLIAVFSGFLVRFMAGSLIQEHIQSTLGIRLLVHGIGLSYNTMYSLPVGETNFITSFPPQCNFTCVDCNSSLQLLPRPYMKTICDCGDGLLNTDKLLDSKTNLIGSTEVDKIALTCDDYIINSFEPLILFRSGEPVSGAVRVNMQLHPASKNFWSYEDVLDQLSAPAVNPFLAGLQSILPDITFFNREITVFSEVPVNLNDYASVRSMLSKPLGYGRIFNFVTNQDLSITRVSYPSYDSLINELPSIQGLKGVIDTVFQYTRNNTIGTASQTNYVYKTSDNTRGVLTTGASLTIPLIVKPGSKIVQQGTNLLCEYHCYQQSTLDAECPNDEWHELFCFDFSEVESVECANCSSDDFDYVIEGVCSTGSCEGSTTINQNLMEYYDISTGVRVLTGLEKGELNLYVGDFNMLGDYYAQDPAVLAISAEDDVTCEPGFFCDVCEYTGPTLEGSCENCVFSGISLVGSCSGCTYNPSGVFYQTTTLLSCPAEEGYTVERLRVPCVNCYEEVSGNSIVWPLSSDCSISLYCKPGLDGFFIKVDDRQITSTGYQIYSGCSSKQTGDYYFENTGDNTIEIWDYPSQSLFSALLAPVEKQSMTYEVQRFGGTTCADGDEFKVILRPKAELEESFSKFAVAPISRTAVTCSNPGTICYIEPTGFLVCNDASCKCVSSTGVPSSVCINAVSVSCGSGINAYTCTVKATSAISDKQFVLKINNAPVGTKPTMKIKLEAV